jgi:hypothetical protein
MARDWGVKERNLRADVGRLPAVEHGGPLLWQEQAT